MITRVALFVSAFLFALGAGPVAKAQSTAERTPVTNQCRSLSAITPSDTVPLTRIPIAIFNGNPSACNISVKAWLDCGGQTGACAATGATQFLNVQPGFWLSVMAQLVMSTGTTCANLVACY